MLSQFIRYFIEFFEAGQALWEDHVSSGVYVRFRPVDCSLYAFHTFGVASGTDDEVTSGATFTCLCRYLHLLLHVCDGNQSLAVEVAAPLWKDLILQVQSSSTRSVIDPYSLRAHFTLAEAGVRIGYDGQA